MSAVFGHKLNRRQFLTGSAVLGAAALAGPTFLTACSGGGSPAGGTKTPGQDHLRFAPWYARSDG